MVGDLKYQIRVPYALGNEISEHRPQVLPQKIPKPRIVYRNTLTTGFRSGFWTYGATVLLMVTHCMHLANNSFDLKVKICF